MKQEEAGVGGDTLQLQLQRQQEHRVHQHPQVFYNISEVYSIRKDSINSSNDHIYKRLSRQFQKIKKIKSETNGQSLLSAEYDYEGCWMRKEFKRIHELYNQSSKTHLIVKRRIDKMRQKVDKIKSQVERDELTVVKEVDFSKVMSKGQSSQSINSTPMGSKAKM